LRQVTDNFSDHPEALQIIHSWIEKLYSQVQEIQKKGKNKAKTTIKNMTARLENMEIKNDNPNKLLEQLV
jgi:23S rRNA maturation mini-RNase III